MSPPTVNAYYNPQHERHQLPRRHSAAAVLRAARRRCGQLRPHRRHRWATNSPTASTTRDGSSTRNGNLVDWWTTEDGKKFEQQADCEVKEYGASAVVGDVKVNGKLTLGENTADNGGLRLAYMALLADAKRKSIDLDQKTDGYTPAAAVLPGLRAELVRQTRGRSRSACRCRPIRTPRASSA